MIDLSFLTEEEQESILAVLKRDTKLKMAEERRVQNLQKTVSDKGQLRYMTGEWFYETKQLRHQDRIHGSEIIRASMRHSHKPLTILELSQIMPEKPSFVSSENKEVFVPPVLCGVLQEPHIQLSNERYQNQKQFERPQYATRAVSQSPTKQRKNPFNSDVIAKHTFEEKDSQLLDGAEDQTQTLNEEPLLSSDSCLSYASYPNDSLITQNASVPMPMPENRGVSTSSFVEEDWPGDPQTNSAALRGILKHLSTSSSTDSLFSRLDLQSPVNLNSPTETCIDRKQVRFSSVVGANEVEWQDRKELEEHSLLDIDSITPSGTENNSDLENIGTTTVGTQRPSINQSEVDSQEGELNCKNEANLQEQEAGQQVLGDVSEHCHSEFLSPAVSRLVSAEQNSGKPVHLETEPEDDRHSRAKATDWPIGFNIQPKNMPERRTDISAEDPSDTKLSTCSSRGSSHAVSPKPRQRLLGIFRREKEKTEEVQNPQKEEETIPQQKEQGRTQNISHCAVETTVDKQEAKPSEMAEVRTLQHEALQNTPSKETMASVSADNQQEAREGRVVQLPERLYNLKAFWERENSGPKIMFTREETRRKDVPKEGLETSHGHLSNSDVGSIGNNLSPQMEMIGEDTAGLSQEKILSPQTDCSFSVDVSKEDGTYRANPVLIYEDTDVFLTGSIIESQIPEPQKNAITPVPFYVAFNTQKQQSDIPVPLPRKSSSSPQEDRPAKISEVKHYLEKEYTEPRVIATRVKEASLSSPLSYLTTSLDTREKYEGESQTCPYKTKSNVVFKSLKVKDNGFATQSPDSSELRSSDSTGDVESTCPQTPRSKDHEDEVRGPSKTCLPRVLPRESSSPKRSKLEGSPLKTFPIDINPQTKVVEEQHRKPTPIPRQKKSPSHEAMQTVLTDTNPSTDITSRPLPLRPEDIGPQCCNVNTQQSSPSSSTSPQSKKASEKKLGTFTCLARSFIPQDYQHYLGPQEQAHVPLFHTDTSVEEKDVGHIPQNVLRGFVGNQSNSPTEGNPPRISSWIVQNKDGNSSQNTTTRAWSLSRPSSGSEILNSFSIYISSR